MSKLNTGACRFCGHTIAIETEEELTSPQMAEEATMRCTCQEAIEYQKEKQRKDKALKNVSALFGQDTTPDKSIRECKAETIILFEHINKSLKALENETTATGEEYKFDALRMKYIEGKTYEDIRDKWRCGRNAPKQWCRAMVERLSIKLFGAKAIDK